MPKLLAPKFTGTMRLKDLMAFARFVAQLPAHRIAETTTLAGMCLVLTAAGCVRATEATPRAQAPIEETYPADVPRGLSGAHTLYSI